MYKNKLTPEEALETIKLRMKYDSKFTLNENKSLVSEQLIGGTVQKVEPEKPEGGAGLIGGTRITKAPTPPPYSSMFPNSQQQFKVGTPTPSTPAAASAPASTPVKTPKTTVPYIPKGLNDTKGVQEFQKWLDSTQGDWAWSPRLQKKYKVEGNPKRGYGKFGPSTEKFWNNPDIKKQYLGFKEGKTPASAAASSTSSTPTKPATSIPTIQPPKTPPQAQIKPTKDVAAKKFAEFAMNQVGSPATPAANTTTKVVANKDMDF